MHLQYIPEETESATSATDAFEVLGVGGAPPVAREPEYNMHFITKTVGYQNVDSI